MTFALDELVPQVLHTPGVNLALSLPRRYRVTGPLELEVLRRTLTAVVARHEALRTRLTVENDEVQQHIDPPATFDLDVTDVSTLQADSWEKEVNRLIRTSSRTPFDLTREHPLKVHLYRRAPDEHILHLNVHHLLFDGQSMRIFWSEVAECYRAFGQDRRPNLKPPALQFGDFSEWQQQWAMSSEARLSIDYWIAGLRGSSEAAVFRGSAPSSSSDGEAVRKLPNPVVRGMASIAESLGVTFAAVALAAYTLILARESGQRDIAVAVPMANRRRRLSDECIGFLVNTHVVRVNVDPLDTVHELVLSTARALDDATAHQEVPLALVVKEIIERGLDDFPDALFRNLFTYHTLRPIQPLSSAVKVEQLSNPSTGHAMADVALQVLRLPDGVLCHLQWDIEQFSEDDAHQISTLYEEACRELAFAESDTLVGG